MASGIESVTRWLADAAGVSPELIGKFAITIAVLVGYGVARRFVARLLARSVDDHSSRYRIVKAGQLLLLFLSFIVLGRVWLQDATGLGTWLGLLSAGVAVSLQDPLENLAGWVYIATSRPFRVGVRIQIGEHAGDVLDVHPFSFTLLEIGNWVNADQSTGRLIHVPNGWLFKHAVAGYDQGFPFIWNEISVTVTFESDWRAAKKALEGVLDEHSEKIDESELNRAGEAVHIQFSRVTPVVWTDTAPEGVRLTMRYLCRPRARRVSASEMWEAILDAFEALPKVDLAYPTTRRFDHAYEGKPALRATSRPARPVSQGEIALLADKNRVE